MSCRNTPKTYFAFQLHDLHSKMKKNLGNLDASLKQKYTFIWAPVLDKMTPHVKLMDLCMENPDDPE